MPTGQTIVAQELKRPLLRALIASVVLGVAISILLVLANRWGEFEIKVILTTVIIAVASVGGLACEQAKTPRGTNLLPIAGLSMTFLVAVLLLFGMWAEVNSEGYWKTVICLSFFAVALVHVCLLSIARLASRFRWMFFVACQMIFGLAALLTLMVIGEIDNARMIQLVAVISILVAGVTLLIPLLHRMSKGEVAQRDLISPLNERNLAEIDHQLSLLKKQVAQLETLRAEIVGSLPSNADTKSDS